MIMFLIYTLFCTRACSTWFIILAGAATDADIFFFFHRYYILFYIIQIRSYFERIEKTRNTCVVRYWQETGCVNLLFNMTLQYYNMRVFKFRVLLCLKPAIIADTHTHTRHTHTPMRSFGIYNNITSFYFHYAPIL